MHVKWRVQQHATHALDFKGRNFVAAAFDDVLGV